MEEISHNKSSSACSPWIMEMQTSPQLRKNYKFDDLRSNVTNISPKLHKQMKMRSWQSNQNKPGSKHVGLGECKAKTYEYGDAMISRDVAYDDFNERGKIEEKLKSKQCHAKKWQQETEKTGSPVSKKKENVSVSSELPVAKSKWGVKLRHVITRDASADDKQDDLKQSLYNFRKLSKMRPRSASESPKKPEEEVGQMSRSKSTNDVVESSQQKDCNKHATKLSFFKRMKSFETKAKSSAKEVMVNVVERRTSRKSNTTKHLSLEDLLNLDKQNLSIDVVKSSEDRNDNVVSGRNEAKYDLRKGLQSVASTDVIRNTNIKVKDTNKCTDSSQDSESKKSVGNLCQEKLNIFGKRRPKQGKRAMSLEELLKLDEHNLSVDVVDKNKHDNNMHQKHSSKFSNCKDSDAGNQFDFFKYEREQNLNKTKISNTDLDKKNIATKQSDVQAVDLSLQNEKACNSPSSVNPDYLEAKLLFDDIPAEGNNNRKYSKLGQIILSNDMRDEHNMVENKGVLSPSHGNHKNTNDDVRSSGLTNYAGRNSECTRQDSVVKHSTLGQIILSDDNIPNNNTIEMKSKNEDMCYANIKTNKLKTGRNLADKIVDTEGTPPKKTECQERNNQINKVHSSSEPKIDFRVDHKSVSVTGNIYDSVDQVEPFTRHSNEMTNVKKEKLGIDADIHTISKQLNIPSVGKKKTDLKESVLPTNSCLSSSNQVCNNKEMGTSITDVENNVSGKKNNGNVNNNSLSNTIGTSEKQTNFTPERKIPDREITGQQPEISSSVPINRKVGKLIIMTGDQRNEQLKNKHLLGKASTKYNGPDNIEDLKKCHKEGFSLTFMSNVLEDDGVVDHYPIPEIVHNEHVVLKSIMHTERNRESKNLRFDTTNLVTIHSYPSEESWTLNDKDQDDENKTVLEDSAVELTSSSQTFPNLKSYEPNYSFDFGSVIQRERQRFDSMDSVGTGKSEATRDPGFDYDDEGEHFNSHHDQDGGHALLF